MQTNFRAALTTVLDGAAAAAGPVLSEKDFVHSVVDGFANGERIPEALFGVPGIPSLAAAAAAEGRHVDLRLRGNEEWERLRTTFRSDLQAIVEGRRAADLEARIKAGAARVVLIPEPPNLRRPREATFRTIPESLPAALAFTLQSILRTDRPYLADLKQCQLASCGKFYFMSVRRNADQTSTGVLPKRYCSEEHMLEARRIRETRRTQEKRAAEREKRRLTKVKRR